MLQTIRANHVRLIDAHVLKATRNCEGGALSSRLALVSVWLVSKGCDDAPCWGEQHTGEGLAFWRDYAAKLTPDALADELAKAEREIFHKRSSFLPSVNLPARMDRIAAARAAA
jgi:hypothetical protein